MRNPDLPKLLRAIGNSENGKNERVIYEQAAIELEKLNKIYKLYDSGYTLEEVSGMVLEILNEAP